MRDDKSLRDIERWFDGESPAPDAVEDRLARSEPAAAHAAYLRTLRAGAKARSVAPEIRDEQFDAFMSGIRDDIEAPRTSHHRGFWALASVVAASLIVAVSAFIILSGGTKPVAARTVVEDYSTDLKGATVNVQTNDQGATVWIKVTKEDLL